MQARASSLPPGAKREGMALVALDVTWGVEIVVVSRCDVLVGQQVSDVEADNLSGVIVCRRSFDAFQESWDEAEVSSACKSHDAVKGPDGDTTPDEAIQFTFEDFEVAAASQ